MNGAEDQAPSVRPRGIAHRRRARAATRRDRAAIYLHTPLVLVHMPGGNGIGAHHTGGIELRHCDVSPGEVVWERIPEGPLRYCTLHATLVT
jgi:hypothetical protein